MIFFTRSILPRSHFEKIFIKYFLPFDLKHSLKIRVCESWTFHIQHVLWVPLCVSLSIYTTYNLKVKSIRECRLMDSRSTQRTIGTPRGTCTYASRGEQQRASQSLFQQKFRGKNPHKDSVFCFKFVLLFKKVNDCSC